MHDIELEYAIPSAEVSDVVTLFYRFRADIRCFEDTERADHAQLRFRLSGGIATYRMPDGSIQDAAPIHIIGPQTGAKTVSVEGPVPAYGSGIPPTGGAELLDRNGVGQGKSGTGRVSVGGGRILNKKKKQHNKM